MEKKISKVTQYKQVEDGEREVVSFVASDGNEFKNEKDCRDWEKQIEQSRKWNLVQTNNHSKVKMIEIPDIWYFPKDEEELEMVKNVIGYNDTYNDIYINGVPKNKARILEVGVWVSNYYVDGGDYRGVQNIYTKDFIMEKLNDFINSFPR